MGLNYVKTHACRNDWILYRKKYENLKEFPRHGESCYKKKENGVEDNDDVTIKGVPSKVMCYLPIIQRFKRLFANVNDAENTRWHVDERVFDGKFFHVADLLK